MKIAVLLPGHIRTWDYCKQNFMDTIYDNNHTIDVFVDTYNELFRPDYELHDENKMNIIKSNDEITSLFDGINVVDLKIENTTIGNHSILQMYKILKITNTYEEYEKIHGKYDLVVRSRFDILLDKKIDYEKIYESCKNSKLIHIGDGAVHRSDNDLCAVCNTDTFKIYGKRVLHDEGPHGSMTVIANIYGIYYSQTIGISIVRLGGPGQSVQSKIYNKTYKISK